MKIFFLVCLAYLLSFPVAVAVAQETKSSPELVSNPSLELSEKNNPNRPLGYRMLAIPGSRITPTANWKLTTNAHTGKKALVVTRTNVGGQFGIYPPFKKIPAENRVRYYKASVWLKAKGFGQKEIYIQCSNSSWTRSGWFKGYAPSLYWKEYYLVIRMAKGDELGQFRIKFRGSEVGDTLYLDDFSLREISATQFSELKRKQQNKAIIKWERVKTPEKKSRSLNLVRNSSFETGFSDWGLAWSMQSSSILQRMKWDHQEHVYGTSSMRIDSLKSWNNAQMHFQSAPIPVVEGKVYTLSAYLKSNEPGLSIDIGLRYRGGIADAASVGKVLTEHWQRFSFSVKIGRDPSGVAIIDFATDTWRSERDFSNRKVWIDAVEFEEGGLSDFQPAPGVEIAGDSSHVHSLFVAGEPIKLLTRFYIPPAAAAKYKNAKWRLEYRFEDVFGNTIDTKSFAITPDGRTNFVYSFIWQSKRLGSFDGHVTLKDGDTVIARAINVFAVVPKLPPADPKRSSIFGCNVNLSKTLFEIAKRIGVRSVRLHEETYLRWAFMQPHAKDAYRYDKSREAVLRDMKKSGMHVLGVLELGSTWASTAPDSVKGWGRQYYPPKLDAWKKFVSDQARHFNGLIDSWEVWNEPYSSQWWKGTAEDYVKMLKVTYAAVKKISPNIQVVGIVGRPIINGWDSDTVRLGALKYLDVFSFHDYLDTRRGGPEEVHPSWRERIFRFKRFLRKSAGKTIPIWNTEAGVICDSYYDFYKPQKKKTVRLSPAYLVRAYATALAAGEKKLYWYTLAESLGPAQGSGFQMLDYNSKPKPIIPAYAVAVKYLDGKKFARELKLSDKTRGFIYSGYGKPVAVLWRILDAPEVTIRLSEQEVRVIDIMGNALPHNHAGKIPTKIGAFPVYIEGQGTVDELAVAIESAWGNK